MKAFSNYDFVLNVLLLTIIQQSSSHWLQATGEKISGSIDNPQRFRIGQETLIR